MNTLLIYGPELCAHANGNVVARVLAVRDSSRALLLYLPRLPASAARDTLSALAHRTTQAVYAPGFPL